jgi:uncharacterized protein (TIGR02271 family)
MAMTEQYIVLGVFTNRARAEAAVAELLQAGFPRDQISFSGHGAITEGLLAELKSLFSGDGTATNNAYADLVKIGVPEEEAAYYQREYEEGRSIVGVTGSSRIQEAADILARHGAYGSRRSSTQSVDSSSSTTTTAQGMLTDTQEQRMRLREEQLQIDKQMVRKGEVRLRKEVVTEQKTIDVPVLHEEVYIEHHPGSGQISDTPIGENEIISIPVSGEQITVSKQIKTTGEVSIHKRRFQEMQQVTDSVRREEARIEREGDVRVQGDDVDALMQQPER